MCTDCTRWPTEEGTTSMCSSASRSPGCGSSCGLTTKNGVHLFADHFTSLMPGWWQGTNLVYVPPASRASSESSCSAHSCGLLCFLGSSPPENSCATFVTAKRLLRTQTVMHCIDVQCKIVPLTLLAAKRDKLYYYYYYYIIIYLLLY
jgi:hypothetical protein